VSRTAGSIVVVVGNPRAGSRTRAVGEAAARLLASAVPDATTPAIDTIELADAGAGLLDWGNTEVESLRAQVRDARALVIATPTYKASFTGLLKMFLDRFDAGELRGIPTVALMTGGSEAHALAVDVHLTPVLVEIGASCPARGVYVWGADQDDPTAALTRWWTSAEPAVRRALR
jgi:FMN reductase